MTNVMVETEPPTDSDRTDGHGCFAIELAPAQGGAAVPPGRYTMVLRAPPEREQITIDGAPADADYELESVSVDVHYDGDATDLILKVPRAATPDFRSPEAPRPDELPAKGPVNSRREPRPTASGATPCGEV